MAGDKPWTVCQNPETCEHACPGVDACQYRELIEPILKKIMVPQENVAPQPRAYKNGSGAAIDDDISQKVEEVFDYWKLIWPIVRFSVPFILSVLTLAWASGIIQIPYARQKQVDDVAAAQAQQSESMRELKTGIRDIHGSIEKLTDKIGDLDGSVRETKAEVRARLYQPMMESPFPVMASPAPAAPKRPASARKLEKPKQTEAWSLFAR
jgi:hypothetical protein